MGCNATFNNISIISWPISFIGDGNRSSQRKQLTCTLSHNVVSSTPRHKLLDVPYNVQPEQLSFIFCLINKMREITFNKTLSILRSLR